MREKAISGMMATVHRRDTDVEEREERISHLKKVIRLSESDHSCLACVCVCVCVLTLCNGVDRSLRN